MEEISTYEDFEKNFEKLKKVIKAKVLGKNGDITIKNKLEKIEKEIMKNLNENNKNEFLKKISILKEYSTYGVHDFKFGKACFND